MIVRVDNGSITWHSVDESPGMKGIAILFKVN